ncbi:MAG TPA: MxaS protein, partial [Burkholderiaceae bacterium]|nr:MxaS protein [Burkholderiaceae bacterium]
GGSEFRAHAPLIDVPDVRRLDLHASLRDPLGQWLVRVNSERMAIPVAVIADLSASVGFEGGQRKLDVLADFVESLSWSAWRNGDSFGFVGCDEGVRSEWVLPHTRARGAGIALAASLRRLAPAGRSAQGLLAAHRHLMRQRSLLFLISDFHLPLELVARALDSLADHEVVPVVLWQPQEFGLGSATGIADVIDPESGLRRALWWRPSLRARWEAAQRDRRAALLGEFGRRRLAPLLIEGAFDADAVTRHFLS